MGGNIDDLNGAGKKPGGYNVTLTVPAANAFPGEQTQTHASQEKPPQRRKNYGEIRDLKIAKLKI